MRVIAPTNNELLEKVQGVSKRLGIRREPRFGGPGRGRTGELFRGPPAEFLEFFNDSREFLTLCSWPDGVSLYQQVEVTIFLISS